ncbi:MAG: sigma-70 family RNA polymerase sigma factor [Clostridia bacterium]|nr:sigma-70 family RNA polymerase sigma factor [Clostridia bacterium]
MLKERSTLAEDNLGLVHTCAKKFCGRGIEYDDLFQAGCLGLVKASNGFDESLGFAFSTYAIPSILGEIRRLFRDGGAVKVSRALKEQSRLAQREKDRLTTELGYEPSLSQLAEVLGVDTSQVAEILCASRPPLSLTANPDNDSEGQIDVPVPSPEDELSDSLFIDGLLNTLAPTDRRLIELRYFKGLTQSKTAEILGMSQVQVSRREKHILMFMRNKANG